MSNTKVSFNVLSEFFFFFFKAFCTQGSLGTKCFNSTCQHCVDMSICAVDV